jgi:hypothetical protein
MPVVPLPSGAHYTQACETWQGELLWYAEPMRQASTAEVTGSVSSARRSFLRRRGTCRASVGVSFDLEMCSARHSTRRE